jgi:REP element-mobilizing transposase RayT
MGRELRAIDRDAIYHAGSRGSNRGPIAWDRHDYASLLGEIGRTATRHHWSVLAWCLMPNHYHLVVRMPDGGFSVGFQQINGNHSRRTNRRYGRCAHLFQNRPWTRELTGVAYLVGAIVYVLRNPVAAGLCRRSEEWAWSSYRASTGLEPPPPWLALDELHPLFGPGVAEARHALSALVHPGHLPVSDTIF